MRYVLTGEGAGDVFTIDPRSGDIHAIKRLDREERATYTLRARAVSNKTSRSLEDWTNFTIKIHDINDNAPTFTKSLYMASVPEMSDVGEWYTDLAGFLKSHRHTTQLNSVQYNKAVPSYYSAHCKVMHIIDNSRTSRYTTLECHMLITEFTYDAVFCIEVADCGLVG